MSRLTMVAQLQELNPFAVPGLPESLEADVWFEDRERFVTTHSGTHAGNAITATMHGQGDRGDQHHSEVDSHRGDEAPIEAALRHALAGGATVDVRTRATVPGGAELVALSRY
jgi:hypothetical protein